MSWTLTRLVSADIYRDGGSYLACFETDDGRAYNVWLQRSKMPDAEGLHHRWLFAYFGDLRPQNSLPVVTGSEEDRELLARLRSFLASAADDAAPASAVRDARLVRLRELLHDIERREPCLPSDLLGRHFT